MSLKEVRPARTGIEAFFEEGLSTPLPVVMTGGAEARSRFAPTEGNCSLSPTQKLPPNWLVGKKYSLLNKTACEIRSLKFLSGAQGGFRTAMRKVFHETLRVVVAHTTQN